MDTGVVHLGRRPTTRPRSPAPRAPSQLVAAMQSGVLRHLRLIDAGASRMAARQSLGTGYSLAFQMPMQLDGVYIRTYVRTDRSYSSFEFHNGISCHISFHSSAADGSARDEAR